jgi:IPTL-CTERM motif
VNGGGYTLSAGIDNWQVAIAAGAPAVASPVPTLNEWAVALLALGIALGTFLWMRRSR